MLIIAGLGNPGPKYQNNRHNVGYMAADAIHRRHSFSPWSKKHSALIADGRIGGEKVLLIKPQTFMNLSGQSVGRPCASTSCRHRTSSCSMTNLISHPARSG